MNVKSIIYRCFVGIAALVVTACADQDWTDSSDDECVEMAGLEAGLTRAGVSVTALKDYVGRSEFDDKDRAVFTSIKRTNHAITQFSYKDIEFEAKVTTKDGKTSIGWTRDKDKGTGGTAEHPDRIYWSDAKSPHTFIGYCAPQQGVGEKDFDWTNKVVDQYLDVYYGSIGDPTMSEDIDFTSTYDSDTKALVKSGNVELRKNDILLTHATDVVASDAIAKIQFRHGLAQVRVIVNISEFAAGGGKDVDAVISDMVIKEMLTMYKWQQLKAGVEELDQSDQDNINRIYSSTNVKVDQHKNVKLWIPKPDGEGEKSSRTFTFYGLAVPTIITEAKPLTLSFRVTYADPMNPSVNKEHLYGAKIGGIHFDAGKCTTISVALNHLDEVVTVGAEYDDWEFIDTPDQGELMKNSTFLTSTDRKNKNEVVISIFGDDKATADDATWLYVDALDEGKLKDVYGNDGSVAHPFTISTADQLLSFAYEVKGTDRKSVKYKDISTSTPTEKTIDGAFDFTGYYVMLDAGLTLQKSIAKTEMETGGSGAPLSWIGIGDTNKPFNGTFYGGMRNILRLYGSPFFIELGPKAHVEQLVLENVIDINGNGGFANVNNGIICACNVDGNVTSSATAKPVGSFVGTNNGLIFACYHIGNLTAASASAVGGLIGYNDAQGKIVASYNVGNITGPEGQTYGVLGQNTVGSELSVIGCFYDKTKAPNITSVAPQTSLNPDYPSSRKTTVEIMKSSFVGDKNSNDKDCLNGIINSWAEGCSHIITSFGQEVSHFKNHYYVSRPAGYPYVY